VKQFQVRLYEPEDFDLWNTFISVAKNATFLFHRDFMNYHSDRFQDYSLLVFENDKLVAVLPANRVEDAIFSHQGLSYGGLVFEQSIKLNNVIIIFKTVLKYLNENRINNLVIKQLPSIYCDYFSDEINYCLFVLNATLIRRDALSVIDLSMPIKFLNNKKGSITKGIKSNLEIKEVDDFDAFWDTILIPNLLIKHQAKPVHTKEEIKLLKHLFPKNIRQFNVYQNNEIVAGTTIFESKKVAHCKYISGNETKSENGSLDFLHNYLITNVFKDKNYFDFGISNESEGRKINSGLLFWKESFGAKTVSQSFYKIDTSNYNLLDSVLI